VTSPNTQVVDIAKANEEATTLRDSPFMVGTFMSVEPAQMTEDFGVMSRGGGDPVLHSHQFYTADLAAPFLLDLAHVGTFTLPGSGGKANYLGEDAAMQAAAAVAAGATAITFRGHQAELVSVGMDDDGQGCGNLIVRTEDGRGDRERVHGDLTVADRDAGTPDFREHLAEGVRVADRHFRPLFQRTGAGIFLHIRRRVGEQHQADPGGIQRESAADAGEDANRVPSGQPLDEDDLETITDRELYVFVRDIVEIFHVRKRYLTEPKPTGCERSDFPKVQADVVKTVVVPFERAPVGQILDDPMGGGERDTATAADFGQAQLGPIDRERVENVERLDDERPRHPIPLVLHMTSLELAEEWPGDVPKTMDV
jgi:hypothetical protein